MLWIVLPVSHIKRFTAFRASRFAQVPKRIEAFDALHTTKIYGECRESVLAIPPWGEAPDLNLRAEILSDIEVDEIGVMEDD